MKRTSEVLDDAAGEFPKTDVRYWRNRLVRRKYVELARPGAQHEYFARIEHAGTSYYFPLSTEEEVHASIRALQIYQTVATKGWRVALRSFAHEFTLAVVWSDNPFACTYGTLLSDAPAAEPGKGERRHGARTAIIEPEESRQAALGRWIGRCPGFVCAGVHPTLRDCARRAEKNSIDLLLINRQSSSESPAPAKDWTEKIPRFHYGIHETSDDVFISVTGVSGGYFLRRRPPDELLEPVAQAWQDHTPTPDQLRVRVRRYIHHLFGAEPPKDEGLEAIKLTPREQEILLRLSKGYHDKQIADTLGISAWTVHNHLKSIFKKMGVHSRTEAVIKYLQK